MATATMSPQEAYSLPPTPKQIDELVTLYERTMTVAALANTNLQDAKDELIAIVNRFGTVPAGAEKSLRLEGAVTILTVTSGDAVAVKEDAVNALKTAMEVNNQGELFPLLFAERTKHSLQEDAATQLRTAKLPQRLVKLFTSLYARCFDVKKKSPSLRIDRLDMSKDAAKAKKAKAR
jgi:hypothetical protein